MPLSQSMMDNGMQSIRAAMGTEDDGIVQTITYTHLPKQGQPKQVHVIEQARLMALDHQEFITDETIQQNVVRLRVPTSKMPVHPTRWDEFKDKDGRIWSILNWRYGPGYPVYDMRCRQTG